ncbi:MAG: zinc ribbon domain-containing protein [bacterium]
MFCSQCGTQNDDNNYKCIRCGALLHPAPPPPVATTDSSLEGLIPYRNSPALIAYYLGVFSVIPCFGILIGIPAFFLGLKGLRLAREHPETKGGVHAWVGIIMGGIFGFGYLLLLIVALLASFARR